jgi:uncharacterized membrane protein YdbT with pleckstrin-like domain
MYMSANEAGTEADIIWVIKPWIVPSLFEETIMAFLVFVVVYLADVYFGTLYVQIFGICFITLKALGLALIWTINALHLLLVRSTSRFTLRGSGLEIQSGIFSRKTIMVSLSNFADVNIIQSILGKIMGSGDIFVRTHGDQVTEGIMKRVRNPFAVEKEIKRVMLTA